MAQQRKINYSSRNFLDVRTVLMYYIKQYYPQLLSDFNDASIGTLMIELNAAVADMLSYHTDRMFNETQIDYAQERRSVLSMARTLGLKIPGKRPSVTLADFSVTVPARGDTFDIRYAPTLRFGAQAVGGGQIFETLEDIDFSSPFTSGGVPNRLILPNIDGNGKIVNYTLVKREIVVNGTTKIFKKVITNVDSRPFLEIVLPDNNILSVEQMVSLEGSSVSTTPTIDQFVDPELSWYEVDSLAEDKIFIEDNRETDNVGIKPGKWVENTRRFVKEYTDKGFCKLTFGSGNADQDQFQQFANNQFTLKVSDFIDSTALGEIPKTNTTLFIRYRVGGGAGGNIGPNTLNGVGNFEMFIDGPNTNINQNIRRSLTVSNQVPAFGGKNQPTVEEVRHMTKYNFSAQNRAVTIKDYIAQIFKMPGQFGVPFRMGVSENQNKVDVTIIGLDQNSKLSNSSTNTLKDNIASWLADYRAINDYVIVRDGKVINIGFDIDLFVDKGFNNGEIINNTINAIKDYFDINKWDMGDDIYLAELLESINNVGGVLNVTSLKVFNKVGGGKYSLNKISQPYVDTETREIDLTDDFALFGEFDTMFEIKNPSSDVRIRVKK
jgi:hypothetical protein